jgi:phosphate starvation-inducible PhoH-like protein
VNFDNAFVILDEAKYNTFADENVSLTSYGENAKFITEPGQVDLPRRTISGLKEAVIWF